MFGDAAYRGTAVRLGHVRLRQPAGSALAHPGGPARAPSLYRPGTGAAAGERARHAAAGAAKRAQPDHAAASSAGFGGFGGFGGPGALGAAKASPAITPSTITVSARKLGK